MICTAQDRPQAQHHGGWRCSLLTYMDSCVCNLAGLYVSSPEALGCWHGVGMAIGHLCAIGVLEPQLLSRKAKPLPNDL